MILIDDENIVREFISIYNELKSMCTKIDMISNISINSEMEDFRTHHLEVKFNKEINDKLERTIPFKIGNLAREWVRMNTPVIAANRIINLESDAPSTLIRLWELKKLELSFEESVINKEYKELFSKNTIDKAYNKLYKLNYFADAQYTKYMNKY